MTYDLGAVHASERLRPLERGHLRARSLHLLYSRERTAAIHRAADQRHHVNPDESTTPQSFTLGRLRSYLVEARLPAARRPLLRSTWHRRSRLARSGGPPGALPSRVARPGGPLGTDRPVLPQPAGALSAARAARPPPVASNNRPRADRRRRVTIGPMLPIMYQDDHVVAIHNPPGLLVHRSELDRHGRASPCSCCATSSAATFIPAPPRPGHLRRAGVRPRQGHRPRAGRAVGAPGGGQDLPRRGARPPARGRPHRPRPHPPAGRRRVGRRRSTDEAQPAVTDFRCLATCSCPPGGPLPTSRYALVELTPHTGRRHQLRRHLEHLAHPIIGDATFGKGRHNRLFQQLFGCHRMLLGLRADAAPPPVAAAAPSTCAPRPTASSPWSSRPSDGGAEMPAMGSWGGPSAGQPAGSQAVPAGDTKRSRAPAPSPAAPAPPARPIRPPPSALSPVTQAG